MSLFGWPEFPATDHRETNVHALRPGPRAHASQTARLPKYADSGWQASSISVCCSARIPPNPTFGSAGGWNARSVVPFHPPKPWPFSSVRLPRQVFPFVLRTRRSGNGQPALPRGEPARRPAGSPLEFVGIVSGRACPAPPRAKPCPSPRSSCRAKGNAHNRTKAAHLPSPAEDARSRARRALRRALSGPRRPRNG